MKKSYFSSTKALLMGCFLAVGSCACAQQLHAYRLSNPASAVEMVDGSVYYYGPSGVFNAHNGKLCAVKHISQFALDPNASAMAIATSSAKKSSLEVYSLWETDRLFAKTNMRVQALCYDATGSTLLVADPSGILHCLNPISLKERNIIKTKSEVFSMTSGQGGLLAAAHKTDVGIYDLKNLNEIETLQTGCATVSMSYSDDGKLLALASADNKLRLYNTRQRKVVNEIALPAQPKMCAFSPDGNYLLVATGTDVVLALAINSGCSITEINLGTGGIEYVGFATVGTPAKKYLVYANRNEVIYKEIANIGALQ